MKPSSLMRRIDAWFTANPGAGLRLADACRQFECTGEQFYRAMDKANRVLGLGLGMEPFFRLGASAWARKTPRKARNGDKSPPMLPGKVLASIFEGRPPPRQRLASGPGDGSSVVVVERVSGITRVKRIPAQETEEWRLREEARRARQKPPRPPKTAKTRGKKVRAWDGEAVE